MDYYKLLTPFFCVLVFVSSASAHPGHGAEQTDPHEIFHYLTSLVHLVPLLTVLGIILFAIMKRRANSKRTVRR